MKRLSQLLLCSLTLLGTPLSLAPLAMAANDQPTLSAFNQTEFQDDTLRVKLKITLTGCRLGDWDTILAEQDNSDNPRLLLALEPIGPGSTFPMMAKDITNFDLEKGFTAVFNIPAKTPPTPVAIYICKDSDKTGKCAGKKKVDVGKLMETYVPPFTKGNSTEIRDPKDIPEMPKPPKATDKIYYFGMLVIDGNKAYVMKDDSMKKNQAGVAQDLKTLGVKQADKVFAEVKLTDALTYSVQPKIEEEVVTVILPRADVKACVPKEAQ